MRVLICDDEVSVRQLYQSEFEAAGAEVATAADGDECIDVAEREQPDLVILDLRMPKRDGLSTLPQLREQNPNAQVVVVSAAHTSQLDKAMELGAAECIDKLEFLMRIPELVERYGQSVGA
jgi:DNA-binding response OmpR family regulator